MKAIASLAFSMASAVGICIGAGALASYVMAEPAGRATSRSAADLWTLTPVKVERGQQEFERLPPQLSTYALQQPRSLPARAAAPEVAAAEPQVMPEGPSPEHQAWCRDRYRSYDPSSDSYRSFSGQTRPCISPFPTASAAAAPQADAQTYSSEHVAWCSDRYRSYRVEDNSYQPYGGARRSCASPFMDGAATASAQAPSETADQWASR